MSDRSTSQALVRGYDSQFGKLKILGERLREIDLRQIAEVVQRIREIAFVNLQTAPILLSTFNEAHLKLGKLKGHLRYEVERAKQRLDEEEARVLLDEVPEIIKTRGLSNTADVRKALVQRDPRVKDEKETIAQLEAVEAMIEADRKALERAYQAVYKMQGDKLQLNPQHNPALSAGAEKRAAIEDEDDICGTATYGR